MIYFVRYGDSGRIKIGHAHDVRRRLVQLRVSSPEDITVIGLMLGSRSDEADLHARFAKYRVRGEWFKPSSDILEFVDRLPHMRIEAADRRRGMAQPKITPNAGAVGRKVGFDLDAAVAHIRDGYSISEAARRVGVSRARLNYHIKECQLAEIRG